MHNTHAYKHNKHVYIYAPYCAHTFAHIITMRAHLEVGKLNTCSPTCTHILWGKTLGTPMGHAYGEENNHVHAFVPTSKSDLNKF